MSRTAVLAGATGLVGGELLPLLLESSLYREVRVLTRRALRRSHPRLRELMLPDFDRLPEQGQALQADDVFCCLGTTLRKAGSRAAFEKVDYGHVLALAKACRSAGARRFFVISAAGASAGSAAYYSRVKAHMETDVAKLGFEATHILRPSLLLGERGESRPAERLGQWISPLLAPLLSGPLRKYRPIEAAEVARAMLKLAEADRTGTHVHHLPLSSG